MTAFAVGLAVIIVALAIAISRPAYQRVGYDRTPVQLVIGTLPAGTVGCQPHEPIPSGTAAVQIHALPAGPGRVSVHVELRTDGRYGGIGGLGTAIPGGLIVAPLAHPITTALVAPLCVSNTGQVAVALEGVATGPPDQMAIAAGQRREAGTVGRARIEDLASAHPRPLWSTLRRLPERIATASGSRLAPWLVALGLAGALLAAAALLRTPNEDRHEA